MEDERAPKKALKGYTQGGRLVGTFRERWTDAVDMYAESMLKFKNWRRSAEDRDAWKWRIEEAKAQIGL